MFAYDQSPWQQHVVNSGVHFPNHETCAKLEKVLPFSSRDIPR